MDELIGARYLVPYVRLFPIWRFGPIYSLLDGHYVRDGWKPDRYGQWEFSDPSKAAAARAR